MHLNFAVLKKYRSEKQKGYKLIYFVLSDKIILI